MITLKKSDWVAAATLVVSGFILGTYFRNWNFDDGLIVYRLVHNVIEHGEWSFNLGEAFNPSTSALNTILLSLLALTGIPIPVAAHAVGTLSLILMTLCVYRILSARLQPWGSLAVSACALWVVGFSSAWGLETYLFLAILLWISMRAQSGQHPWVALSLLVLARPDGMVVLAMYGLYYLVRFRHIPWRAIGTVAAILGPWIAFSVYKFGQPFPDTLSVKMWQGRSGLWGQGWIYAKGLGKHLQTPLDAGVNLLALFCFFGVGFAFKALPLLFLFAITQQVSYSILNVPFYHWYVTSLDLSRWILATYFLAFLAQVALKGRPQSLNRVILAVVSSITLVVFGQLLGKNPTIDPRDEGYREAAQLVMQLRPSAQSIAAVEVGTVGYTFPGKILDLAGLASKNPELVSGAHTDYFFSQRPDVVLLHAPTWHFESAVADDARFEALYEEIGRTAHFAFPMVIYGKRALVGDESIKDFVARSYPALTVMTGQPPSSADPLSVCIFDRVNGKPTKPGTTLDAKALLFAATGWSAFKNVNDLLGPISIVLKNTSTQVGYIVTQEARLSRVDVAEHLETAKQVNSGFAVKASALALPSGVYELWSGQRDPNGIERWCGPVLSLSVTAP